MAEKKNGRSRGAQPSKPSRRVTEKVESVVAADRGMTIREEFAMAALQGFLSAPADWDRRTALEFTAENVAALAREYADALLTELAKDGAP